MRCVNKENAINRPSLKFVQFLPFLNNEALTTKDMEVTHLVCATMHQLVTGFRLVNFEIDPARHIARSIDDLSPEPSQNPMLVEHRPSHSTQVYGFPFHHAILGRHIWTRKLVFKAQVMAKGFESRVFAFRAIITMDRSYGISVPLILQPQDKISNKTKLLPFPFKKEHPRIPRVVIHYNKDVPLTTRKSHKSWATKSIWSSSHGSSVITSVRGGEKKIPSWHASTAHKPTLSQTSTVAILRPN
jgi:hypothetical protein